jgi:hypothetical protein
LVDLTGPKIRLDRARSGPVWAADMLLPKRGTTARASCYAVHPAGAGWSSFCVVVGDEDALIGRN